MCGILAQIGEGAREGASAALKQLHHRGPDSGGEWSSAMFRLACTIRQFSHAKQPAYYSSSQPCRVTLMIRNGLVTVT